MVRYYRRNGGIGKRGRRRGMGGEGCERSKGGGGMSVGRREWEERMAYGWGGR